MTDGGRAAYNGHIEALRDQEYLMLKDEVYLDHAGTTLYAKSLIDKFAADMTYNLFGNPHSASSSSQTSTARIEDIRLRVLQFFNADPSEFDIVFVANATAAIKLVAEAFRAAPGGFSYAYHQACHASLVGVRQEATDSFCFHDGDVENWINGEPLPNDLENSSSPTLFAYPAQSNMDGRRFPLDWTAKLRSRRESTSGDSYTLLDAAAYVSTSPLDLGDSDHAPDFTVLSFNKIFGFPDLGALVVRRQAAPAFRHRKYFGGGTVDVVVCVKEQWHASKTQSLHDSLEDGTLPIHSIIALDAALDIHRQLFGTMKDIASHTSYLARRLRSRLTALHHQNGAPVCTIYSPQNEQTSSGPVVAFNLQNSLGAWISLTEFEKLAALKKFHVRTGGLCNPGGIATALSLEPWEIRRNFSSGFRCGNENDIISGKPTGVIRVSLGAMSTVSDVDKFVTFMSEFYKMRDAPDSLPSHHLIQSRITLDLCVEDIMVYPIKSCGGYRVPKGVQWDVRPEGLAWDREWCLMHRGTGQALSQKRHPRMALFRPNIDFTRGVLELTYRGPLPQHVPSHLSIPISANPALFESTAAVHRLASRVCGEEITAQKYTSATISDFFSDILGVPCALARFPPGGEGNGMRHAKAHLQKHQRTTAKPRLNLPGGFPGVATPPESDSEGEQRRILLSNESPILSINSSSLETLNREIVERGGKPVSPEVFRANIVIGSSEPRPETLAYAEDHWSTMKIGQQDFKMLGSCRRCHMVCIDQDTALKSEEPFVTLTKTRRFDGKVFFGTHMCHLPATDVATREEQHPTIQVGDKVLIDALG
ncbi:MOSC N-terminal beta barrel domain-containing protein [Xylariales sp. AK1849]|nr:MOSC N-terminal beta barrel domain-containing protein [Xylariales sp. AK1849]